MKPKTYLLKLNSGPYSEAAYALVRLGPLEAAAITDARSILKTFGERRQGWSWSTLDWRSQLTCVVLKRVPSQILKLLNVAEEAELFQEGEQGWLVLTKEVKWSEGKVRSIAAGLVWPSGCEGLRCSAESVQFIALAKDSAEAVESDDLNAILFPI